MTILMDF